ncbi:MAG: AAA domain-containing protein [Bacteroidales bacterium]
MEKKIVNNQDFINLLREKLTKGNKRSIHLNVLPRNSATRIDLTELDLIDRRFSETFLEKLLKSPKFKLDVTFDKNFDFNELDELSLSKTQKAIRRLKSISKQNTDYFLEHGIEPFGFGFPIIYKRDKSDPKSIIKAPLFIWLLEIEENRQFSNKWTIKREEDFPIYFNYVLLSHIERDENIKIDPISKEFLEDSLIDSNELVELTKEFLHRFASALEGDVIIDKIFDICHSEKLLTKSDLITDKPVITGSGVFGLFINQKQSIIEDVKKLSEEIEKHGDDLINESFNINPFSSVATDPSQQSVLNNISGNNKIIIHGPPGTGKSQSLTAIITNALANKAKCLIVCEKRTALDVIFKNLSEVGLEVLCGLIEDTSKDRRKIVEKARETIDDVLQTKYRYTNYHFEKNIYQRMLDDIKQLAFSLNDLHKKFDNKLLGDKNWSSIVGHFLKIAKTNENFNRLETELPNDKFSFKEDEYNVLKELVLTAQNLKDEYNEFDSSLERLNYSYFADKQYLDVKSFFNQLIPEISESINKNLSLLPKNKKEYSKNMVSFLSIFSKKYKGIKTHYKNYLSVIDKIMSIGSFQINLSPEIDYQKIDAQLSSFLEILSNINSEQNKVNAFIKWHQFKNNLSPIQKTLIDLLIQTKEKFIDTFNAWYFNRILSNNYIPEISSNESLPNKLIVGFDELKKENTKNALHYWQEKRIESIYRYNRQNEYLNAKQLYAKVSRNTKKKTLRQIIKKDFELFTDLFPVLLVNPSVCSSLFDLKENLFDVVIFDEASQLRIEDTFCALIRGKIKVISGDEHQMPPSSYFSSTDYSLDTEDFHDEDEEHEKKDAIIDLANKESLLEYASDLNYFDTYLDIHYRSKHPDLIDFSNAAFYSNRLTPMPAFDEYKAIRFISVDGLYDNQVNVLEAKQVIQILRDNLFENNNGELPSVGIATFNIHQRNLIWDFINKEAKVDNNFGHKVERFFEKGLFIKNLENIQGDERDVIIISTTFGINKNGVFSERFGPLNVKSKGHRLLNVIITRAKYQLFICTSFPSEKIQQYKEHIPNYGNVGRGVLYAYLAYAKSIEEKDYESKQFILDLLDQNGISRKDSNENSTLFGTESPFEQEVVDCLINNGISTDRIELQHECGGFRIDIILKSIKTGKPIIAIECDGASFHSSNEAYMWDVFRQKQLEGYGFKFYRIWSTNWWQNQENEINKLLEFIRQFDASDNSEIDSIKFITLSDKEIKNLKQQEIVVEKNLVEFKE